MAELSGYGITEMATPVPAENIFASIWRFFRNHCITFPRDMKGLTRFLKFKRRMNKVMKNNRTIAEVFGEFVKNTPNKVCFYFEDQKWTFKQVDEFSNKVANTFLNLGFEKGNVVALFMESCPEYVAIWLGLSKIGVCTALINFNLIQQSLAHCILAAESKAVIFGAELSKAMKELQKNYNLDGVKFFSIGEVQNENSPANFERLLLESASSSPPPKVAVNIQDPCMFIYTSGTTGLPKPAIISNLRYQMMANSMYEMFKFRHDDVLYTPLPLYHGAGGSLGVGQALLNGMTVAIRKKFSASKFWDDCIKYNCTITQYIGETCRYLLSQPPKPQDRAHKVKSMLGNGLRPQLWMSFVTRFNIKNVYELYGATEGNSSLVNITGQIGAVGFLPQMFTSLYPVTLIKVNEATGEPIRDKNGVCIRCKAGEPGEIVGRIIQNDPYREFPGYVSKEATQKKIIRDVYSKGDYAFASGDILVMDELGYCYFKDRTGDTYRWKGENVATAEVEGVISNNINFRDCCVYGVEIPGCEGRAGMAAIVDEEGTLDVNLLAQCLAKQLPVYARPIIVRVSNTAIQTTGTFKMLKTNLLKEGYNPNLHRDKMFYWSVRQNKFLQLTQTVYEDIKAGRITF